MVDRKPSSRDDAVFERQLVQRRRLIEAERLKAFTWGPARAARVFEVVRSALPRETSRVTRRPTRSKRARPELSWAAALVALACLAWWGWRSAVVSMPPPEAQGVRLDSRRFADGSVAEWTGGSHPPQAVEAASGVRVQQALGSVTYRVRPQPDEQRFEVKTGPVRVVVHGTVFTVRHEPGRTHVAVEEGLVAVHGSGPARLVRAGQALTVSHESVQAPDEPPIEAVREPAVSAQPADGQPESGPETPGIQARPAAPHERVTALLDQADAARQAGEWAEATRVLRHVVAQYPADPRAAATWFSLARLYRREGRHVDAAQAFERSSASAPGGPLGPDALGEAVASWLAAGQRPRARQVAERYLSSHPDGSAAARLQKLLE